MGAKQVSRCRRSVHARFKSRPLTHLLTYPGTYAIPLCMHHTANLPPPPPAHPSNPPPDQLHYSPSKSLQAGRRSTTKAPTPQHPLTAPAATWAFR